MKNSQLLLDYTSEEVIWRDNIEVELQDTGCVLD